MSATSVKTYTAIDPRERPESNEKRGTARKDTARRIIENGWHEGCFCKGEYTDDYKRDMARDYGRGEVSEERVLDKLDYSSVKCWVEEDTETDQQTIIVYNNFWSYEVPLDSEKVRFEF